MKAFAGQAAALLARLGILDALEFVDRSTDRVGILAFHRIDDLDADPDLDPGLISATPEDFQAQMQVVASHYNAISLGDLVATHTSGRSLPKRAVLLTFDDGYRDFARHAWPILKSFDLPAVLFVPTSFPDHSGPGFWWDRLHAALRRTSEKSIEVEGVGSFPLGDETQLRTAHRVLRTHAKTLPHAEALAWIDGLVERLAKVPPLHRVLGWDALREMAKEGLSVCSHGNLHALYTQLSASERMEDLLLSKARIETELGDSAPPPVLAYPAAAWSPAVSQAAQNAGYRIAFGGRRGIDRIPFADPFDLMRIPVHRYGTALFRAQLRPSVSRLGSMLAGRRA